MLSVSDYREVEEPLKCINTPCLHIVKQGALILEGTYSVYLGEHACGKVQILKKGLYYRFYCRCSITSDLIYRLRVLCTHSEMNLGVLTPMDDGFILRSQIPVKRFSEKPVRFVLVPVHGMQSGFFAPIIPEEPFSYMERLKDAYLIRKDSDLGAWIK